MASNDTAAGTGPGVSVIIPAYTEGKNLPLLVPHLHDAFRAAGVDVEIIIVDDNSPDDTIAVCNALAQRHPLRLATRPAERGVATAVIHGMRLARGATLVVMHANLSHPPERAPDLAAALADPAVDFVLASPSAPAGPSNARRTAIGWLNTKLATLLAKPLAAVKDPLTGFFAIRTDTFLKADKLDPVGYEIGLELIVKCRVRTVVEVPFAADEPLRAPTKLTRAEQVNYFRHVKRLFDYKAGGWAQIAQFVTVGATGSVVDLLSLKLLLAALSFPVARGVAIWAAMTWNFYLNRRLTFSYARKNFFLPQYVMFCGACAVGAVVNWCVSIVLPMAISYFATRPFLAAFCGIVAGTGFNFGLSRFVVFRKARLNAATAPPPSLNDERQSVATAAAP